MGKMRGILGKECNSLWPLRDRRCNMPAGNTGGAGIAFQAGIEAPQEVGT